MWWITTFHLSFIQLQFQQSSVITIIMNYDNLSLNIHLQKMQKPKLWQIWRYRKNATFLSLKNAGGAYFSNTIRHQLIVNWLKLCCWWVVCFGGNAVWQSFADSLWSIRWNITQWKALNKVQSLKKYEECCKKCGRIRDLSILRRGWLREWNFLNT